MYQLIYDFIHNSLIGSVSIQDTYISQLSVILTHTTIILLYVALVVFIINLFKLVSNLLRF